MSANKRLVRTHNTYDTNTLTDLLSVVMANIEDALLETGAEPTTDYNRMDLLREAKDMGPMQRAETLASMSDSFNKTMASFKRLSPELNKQAIQLDVLQRLVSFAQARFPQHLTAMVELLEPFGEELAKVK